MNKSWLKQLAADIEARYGKQARDNIFGDIDGIKNSAKSKAAWFDNFTTGLDALDDKEMLQKWLAYRCPCGSDYEKDGARLKEFYDKSKDLEEFVEMIRAFWAKKWADGGDRMELRGNVLYPDQAARRA